MEKPDLDSYENSLRDLGEEEEKEDPMISTYKCQETGKVEIGDTVYLCIHLKEYKLRLHFKIEVDSSSTLDIAGGYYLAKQVATKADLKKNIKELSMVGQISQKFTKIPVVSIIYLFLDLL